MDETLRRQAEQIFKAAIDRDPTARDDFLSEACGSDVSLRQEVRSLLEAFDGSEDLADRIEVESRALLAPRGPLERIGRYRILAPLGQGGMGAVYRAEQDQPQRTVALKVIRDGFESPRLKRRFELEAEVLGRLQHVGIAQIFEAGTADQHGRTQPFFAMELVDGVPIQTYCANRDLDQRARLRLFMRVCDAIQHAHQMGVIHRDLKPDNILVTADGQPKVLDFGVARAVDADLAVTRAETNQGQLLGTIPYMSPEQASGTDGAIDTRSDVYALGVILFQLLTGCLPHDLRGLPLPQAVRTICEQDAPRAGSVAPGLAADLDTIIGKALARDRDQRYVSAAALADDLNRFLNNEPILARAASPMYQLRKFAARHRVLVLAGTIALLALVIGTAAASFGLWQARQQRGNALRAQGEAEEQARQAVAAQAEAEAQAARAEAVADFLHNMLSAVQPSAGDRTYDVTVAEMLDEAAPLIETDLAGDPTVQRTLLLTLGASYLALGSFDQAEAQYARAVRIGTELLGPEDRDTLRARNWLAWVAYNRGDYATALRGLEDVYALRLERFGPEDPDTLTSKRSIAAVLFRSGRRAEAEAIYHETLEQSLRVLGADATETIDVMISLATVLREKGRHLEAIALYEDALAQTSEHRDSLRADIHNGLSQTLADVGRLSEAEDLLRSALADRERRLGVGHPKTLRVASNLGLVLSRRGALDEAETLLRRCLDGRRTKLGENHPDTLRSIHNLASLLGRRRQYEQAGTMYEQAYEQRTAVLGPLHADTISSATTLAVNLSRRGRRAEGIALLEDLLVRIDEAGILNEKSMILRLNLGLLHKLSRDYERAEQVYRDLLTDRETISGQQNESTLRIIFLLGRLYQDTARLDLAEQYLRRAYDLRRSLHPPGHRLIADAAHALAVTLRSMERYEDAIPLHEVKFAYERDRAPDGQETWASLANLGWSRRLAGQYEDGRSELLQAAAGLEQTLDATHTFIVSLYILAGECGLGLEDFASAEQCLTEAQTRAARAGDTNQHRKALERLIDVYERSDQPDRAEACRTELAALNETAEAAKERNREGVKE